MIFYKLSCAGIALIVGILKYLDSCWLEPVIGTDRKDSNIQFFRYLDPFRNDHFGCYQLLNCSAQCLTVLPRATLRR